MPPGRVAPPVAGVVEPAEDGVAGVVVEAGVVVAGVVGVLAGVVAGVLSTGFETSFSFP